MNAESQSCETIEVGAVSDAEGGKKEGGINILPITTDKLLLVAGLLWAAAGASILNIGVQAFLQEPFAIWIPVATLAVFSLFYFMIFRKMVGKNEKRIRNFEAPKTSIFRFLDVRGYVIMAFMMTLGITLRSSGLIPGWFFAFFYTGLGAALFIAGVGFFIKYFTREPRVSDASFDSREN